MGGPIVRSLHRRPIVGGAVALLVAIAAGCSDSGPEIGSVTGLVTLDGKPLAGAQVEFQPDTGAPSYGATNNAGEYDLIYTPGKSGALVGKHTVRITTYRATGEPGSQKVVLERVPPQFNAASTLVREVKAGSNKFNFTIMSKP